MPPEDRYNEVVILSITGIIVFLVLAALVVFILLFYQKKKFMHREQLADMGKQYSEELLRSQLELQEHTFSSISQEIHDNVGQVLSLAKIQLNILDQGGTFDRDMVTEIRSNIGRAMEDLRDMAHGLSTERAQLVSLSGTIKAELQRIGRSGTMATSLNVSGTERDLDNNKKLIFFRMVQEGLQNIIKHAGAAKIDIDLAFHATSIVIKITDNGKGFDAKSKLAGKKDTGMGLRNIIGRAEMIGGHAEINSTIGNGTTVLVGIPI